MSSRRGGLLSTLIYQTIGQFNLPANWKWEDQCHWLSSCQSEQWINTCVQPYCTMYCCCLIPYCWISMNKLNYNCKRNFFFWITQKIRAKLNETFGILSKTSQNKWPRDSNQLSPIKGFFNLNFYCTIIFLCEQNDEHEPNPVAMFFNVALSCNAAKTTWQHHPSDPFIWQHCRLIPRQPGRGGIQ